MNSHAPTERNVARPDARHRVLTGVTRSRLLGALRAADRPLGIRDLAEAVGLHPNSVREQLDRLVGAGLVTRETAPPAGRGRPALRYVALPADDDAGPYRELARVLADELARLPDPAAAATSAGERWGRALVTDDPVAPDAGAARSRLVALLDDAGFAPDPVVATDEPVRLRRCPFAGIARDETEVVCNVHLGLMRGALRELGAPLDAVRLEPFVAPNLCLAHLADTTDPEETHDGEPDA